MKYILVICCIAMPSLASAQSTSELEFFENKIRPIFSENCYKCHSAAAGKTKANLALDSKQGVLKGGESGAAVVPGQPEKSLLIKAVSYASPNLQMPPKGKLSAQQIADLTQWIKSGAADPREGKAVAVKGRMTGLTDEARSHWVFQPVRKLALPPVKDGAWVQTPVDAFILARLESAGLKPNPPATREELLRRATFDLIGLPPTTDELKAFLSDQSPDAFAKVVDRLLASPHYGEHWARHWLDTARYADTAGINTRLDSTEYRYPYAWVYRDYVINAFNSDKPYDRFILEQLAADKLGLAANDPGLAGLGFLSVGERFPQANDTINEKIDVVTKGFLGLTVTCARCHDHVYDPIPTADYYSLHGVFANIYEPKDKPIVDVPNAQTSAYVARKAGLEQQNRDVYYQTVEKLGGLFRHKAATYMIAVDFFRNDVGREVETIKARQKYIERHQLEKKLLGSGATMRRFGDDDPVWGPLMQYKKLPAKDYAVRSQAIAAVIAGGKKMNPLVAALFDGAAPGSLAEVESRYNQLFAGLEPKAHAYLAAKSKAKDRTVPGFEREVVQLIESPFEIAWPAELTSIGMKERIKDWPMSYRNVTSPIFNALNELDLTHPGAPGRAMIVADVDSPKDSHILIRGQAQVKGDIVPRRFLEVLAGAGRQSFKIGSGRLELARAIATKDNPLTARVAVNRVWMHHVGEGIVPTPDDLGVAADVPSHRELLDWLADFFVENGWSFKKLHRVIMLSGAYQQSARSNAEYTKIDPGNRLVWRANVRRLPFEAVRDSLLVFTGKLDSAVGGKPVNLTDEPYSYRRSIYGFIDRGRLPELMQQYDFSDPRLPTSKRNTTIVPQQALFLLNSPMAVDVARKIVARAEFTAAPDNPARVTALYRIVFQRSPTEREIEIGAAFIAGFKEAPKADAPVVSLKTAGGKTKDKQSSRTPIRNPGEMVDRRPLTAWEQYTQALLFTNEVAFVK